MSNYILLAVFKKRIYEGCIGGSKKAGDTDGYCGRYGIGNSCTNSSKEDVLALLVHLGYLAFDRSTSMVYIPNVEIRGELRNVIEGEYWKKVVASIEKYNVAMG